MHPVDLPWAGSYQGLPLDGSPAARLRDDAARLLASGLAPRCPHGAEAIFWYLPAGRITCPPCSTELLAAAAGSAASCHACGEPALAVAAWATAGIACFADLCESCGTLGLLPVAPN